MHVITTSTLLPNKNLSPKVAFSTNFAYLAFNCDTCKTPSPKYAKNILGSLWGGNEDFFKPKKKNHSAMRISSPCKNRHKLKFVHLLVPSKSNTILELSIIIIFCCIMNQFLYRRYPGGNLKLNGYKLVHGSLSHVLQINCFHIGEVSWIIHNILILIRLHILA